MTTVRPIIVTADLDRLLTFYTELLGAEEIMRFPEDGPVFYVGLTLGDSELGLSTDASVVAGPPGRMLLSIEVADVDALLPIVAGPGREAPSRGHDNARAHRRGPPQEPPRHT